MKIDGLFLQEMYQFLVLQKYSCWSVKPVLRIIKNFAHSAKWHILLNNYTFLDVNHRIRTESRKAEFFVFIEYLQRNNKVFKNIKTFKNINSKINVQLQNYCFLKFQFFVTAYLLPRKLMGFFQWFIHNY